MEFPLMLLKPGSMLDWDGASFDYVIVADEDALKAAESNGFALPGEKPKKVKAK